MKKIIFFFSLKIGSKVLGETIILGGEKSWIKLYDGILLCLLNKTSPNWLKFVSIESLIFNRCSRYKYTVMKDTHCMCKN